MKKIILSSLILLNFVFIAKDINAADYADPVVYYNGTPTTNYSGPEQHFITPPPPAIIIHNPETVSITPKVATPNTAQTVIQQKKSGVFSKILAPFRFMGRTIKKTYEVTKKTFEVTKTLLLITTTIYLIDYFFSLHGYGGHICSAINKSIVFPFHVLKGAKANTFSNEKLKSVVETFKSCKNVTAKTEKQSCIKYLLNLLKTLITKIIKLIRKSKPEGAQALRAINQAISQQELTGWQKLKAFTLNLRSSLNAYQCHQSLNAQAMADMSLSLENLNSLLDSYSQCVSK
ncbi:MAG: hypothetical protein WC436_01665 [Candidatus Babeliales bacterium]